MIHQNINGIVHSSSVGITFNGWLVMLLCQSIVFIISSNYFVFLPSSFLSGMCPWCSAVTGETLWNIWRSYKYSYVYRSSWALTQTNAQRCCKCCFKAEFLWQLRSLITLKTWWQTKSFMKKFVLSKSLSSHCFESRNLNSTWLNKHPALLKKSWWNTWQIDNLALSFWSSAAKMNLIHAE